MNSATRNTIVNNYDETLIKHMTKYGEELSHPNGEYSTYKPRLLNLKRENNSFVFSFRIDSLPIDLLGLNAKFPGTDPNPFDNVSEYYETVYFQERYAGNLKRTDNSLVKDDSVFFHYNFEIQTPIGFGLPKCGICFYTNGSDNDAFDVSSLDRVFGIGFFGYSYTF